MSCEKNRFRYFEKVAVSGGALANALGGEGEARAVLEQVFNTARNDRAGSMSPLQQHRAAGRTLQLFEEMEQRHGLSRPTHSNQGMRLPRRGAQFGYQAVYDTIEAARAGKALPGARGPRATAAADAPHRQLSPGGRAWLLSLLELRAVCLSHSRSSLPLHRYFERA
ncbi:MAG: hypothetical protein IVW55_17545 [Chloroflexi bacterium]|nr:hypothetical protein [Chloroflexota bacterium]